MRNQPKVDAQKGGTKSRPKVIAVLPAYNAAKTLARFLSRFPPGCVDEILLCDDASSDGTVEIARSLGLSVVAQPVNRGYGANQKAGYDEALRHGADIVVMIHPDGQYDPCLIPHMAGFVAEGVCDVLVGCRIRSRREARQGGMPLYKYLGNRFLTILQNLVLRRTMGEYHSGFRVYRREVLETIPYRRNSQDFAFDGEFLIQAAAFGFRIGDAPVAVLYSSESSSVGFATSVKYGLSVLGMLFTYLLHRFHLWTSPLLRAQGLPYAPSPAEKAVAVLEPEPKGGARTGEIRP